MLRAFIDDSGSETGERWLYMAGYLASADVWHSFSIDWAKELKKEPAIDSFHMVEANGLRGEFKEWSDKDRCEKINRLAQVINRYELTSIECSVSRVEFDRIVKPVINAASASPYVHCYNLIMLCLAVFINRDENLDGPVDFVFDQQELLVADALMWFNFLRSTYPPHISKIFGNTPIFRDDKNLEPLQAADMLAWHLRRKAEGTAKDNHLSTLDLIKGAPHIVKYVTPPELKIMAKSNQELNLPENIRSRKEWKKMRRDIRDGVVVIPKIFK